MYPHFIEVHTIGVPIIVNVDQISCVVKKDIVIIGNKGAQHVDESYDEIKELISDSGCLITKSDPRIDPKPLTMSDMDELIGEPVWNSNRRQWALVVEHVKSEDEYEWVTFRPYKDIAYDFDEDDLTKYPMYRMKVTE